MLWIIVFPCGRKVFPAERETIFYALQRCDAEEAERRRWCKSCSNRKLWQQEIFHLHSLTRDCVLLISLEGFFFSFSSSHFWISEPKSMRTGSDDDNSYRNMLHWFFCYLSGWISLQANLFLLTLPGEKNRFSSTAILDFLNAFFLLILTVTLKNSLCWKVSVIS